jgi:hypothetical protein
MASVTEITCPDCDKTLKVPDSVFGKKIKCKYCGHAFVVEDPDEDEKPAKPAKGAVKPSKPGGAVVKTKKEDPKPEEKPAAPAPYKFEDDDDDAMGAKPNPLGMVSESDVPRCPFCAAELDPPDAIVCLSCGFNNVTRVRAETKKVWAPDASDWMNHLGPGIGALIIFIALIVLDLICLLNMRDWLTGTFLQKEEKGADGDIAFYVKPGAFIALIWAATVLPLVGTGRFAYKRLAVDNKPSEKLKK